MLPAFAFAASAVTLRGRSIRPAADQRQREEGSSGDVVGDAEVRPPVRRALVRDELQLEKILDPVDGERGDDEAALNPGRFGEAALPSGATEARAKDDFAKRFRPHTTFRHEEDRFPVLRSLGRVTTITGAVRGGCAFAVHRPRGRGRAHRNGRSLFSSAPFCSATNPTSATGRIEERKSLIQRKSTAKVGPTSRYSLGTGFSVEVGPATRVRA
jgi:hypothetical protein